MWILGQSINKSGTPLRTRKKSFNYHSVLFFWFNSSTVCTTASQLITA